MENNYSLEETIPNADDEKIVVIVTGGMIAAPIDSQRTASSAENANKQIIESIGNEIKKDAIEIVHFSLVDSSSIDFDFLLDLAKLVQRKVKALNIKGVVIIHGTDTMEITAYFLYRCVYPNSKPIVVTGSQRSIKQSDYDGRTNITNAIKQVFNPETVINAPGVTINFFGQIHSPISLKKEHSFSLNPFSSGQVGVLGIMHSNRIIWLNNQKKSIIIPLPVKLHPVPIVQAFPGATENCLDGFLNTNFKCIVVVAYGCGNVNEAMHSAIENVINKGLQVVLVTNCKYGGVFSEYAGKGGSQSLRDLGVIMADDLNPYQAMLVAALVLDNERITKGTNLEIYFSNKLYLHVDN